MSAVTQHHADELARGADELGVALDADKQRQLLAYLALLIKWNKAYNLTAAYATRTRWFRATCSTA